MKPYIHYVDIKNKLIIHKQYVTNWFFLEFNPLNFTHFPQQSMMHHNPKFSTLNLSLVVFSLSTAQKQHETADTSKIIIMYRQIFA